MTIRVLIVDDDHVVCGALRLYVESTDDIECVGEVHDGDEVIPAIQRHFPDVVLMDVRMARMNGIAATEQVRRLPNPPHVLLLTTFSTDESTFRAIAAGAAGYLAKTQLPAVILASIRDVVKGHGALSPEASELMIRTVHNDLAGQQRQQALELVGTLTPRELDIVQAVGRGKSNGEIAQELFIGEATVKTHLASAQAKLGATGRVEVGIIADRAGLLVK